MIKRLIKRVLLLAGAVVNHDSSAKIFFYHDIGKLYTPMGTDKDIFWAHMDCLIGRKPSAGHHQVCFDDGFRGVWDERERLRAQGIAPMVCVAIRLVGAPGYLTWDEIRVLNREYGFTFVSHTWSHQTLAGEMIEESPIEERTDGWYRRELIESKVELERQLSCGVTALCFPVGNFSDEVVQRCRAAGYEKLYASYPGNITNEYIQPRNLVQDFSVIDFKLALKGGMMVFRRRYLRMHKG